MPDQKNCSKWLCLPVGVLLFFILAACWPGRQDGAPAREPRNVPPASGAAVLETEENSEPDPEIGAEEISPHTVRYSIEPGDTLSAIFERFGLGHEVMYAILASDESLLALDTLRPGNALTFQLDSEGRLEAMELFVHAGNRVVYRLVEDNFDYEEILLEGEWLQEVLTGEIHGSFYGAAQEAGLQQREVAQVASLFEDQVHFARQIRAGDRFEVVRSLQVVEGEATGQSRIDAARIVRRNRVHSAFLAEDGSYYDQKGESLMRAFDRYPMSRQHRVSSHFNPRRRHPVTGRIAPHNGVDFAMPTGTPVLATADGVVTKVQNHPFAGKYVEIQHGGHYATRYLHLSRSLVKRGQNVSRGQRIALSGNTGRSTGPHLHFELHMRGRPVNPLTADIPRASALPKDQRAAFDQNVRRLVRLMEAPSTHLAMRQTDTAPTTP